MQGHGSGSSDLRIMMPGNGAIDTLGRRTSAECLTSTGTHEAPVCVLSPGARSASKEGSAIAGVYDTAEENVYEAPEELVQVPELITEPAKAGTKLATTATATGPLDMTTTGRPRSALQLVQGLGLWFRCYFSKWRGASDTPVTIPPFMEMFLSFIGAFTSLLLVCALNQYASPHMQNIEWVALSFGASVVLLFAVPESKLAQPRNFVGGQIIGAFVGVCIRLALKDWIWISGPLATGLALTVMQLTKTTHPPGGSTALAVGLSPELLPWQGFQVVLVVTIGSIAMLLVGLILNNFSPRRKYPTYWFDERL